MRRITLGASLLALVALLGLRAAHHAMQPPFSVGVTLRRRPRLQIEGLHIERSVGRGTMRIDAQAGAPGQHHLGHIALGPSSHLDLQEVRIRYEAPGAEGWSARGGTGRLEGQRLEITDGVVLVASDGREKRCRRLRIRLRTGAVSVD